MTLENKKNILNQEDWEVVMEALELKESVRSKGGCITF